MGDNRKHQGTEVQPATQDAHDEAIAPAAPVPVKELRLAKETLRVLTGLRAGRRPHPLPTSM